MSNAAAHLIGLMKRDGRLAYLIGPGSQSYDLLTQEAADYSGRDVAEYRQELEPALTFQQWYSEEDIRERIEEAEQDARGTDSMRAHVERFATNAGWKPADGEGAFEYVQRISYHQGWQDGRREGKGDFHRDLPEVERPE